MRGGGQEGRKGAKAGDSDKRLYGSVGGALRISRERFILGTQWVRVYTDVDHIGSTF